MEIALNRELLLQIAQQLPASSRILQQLDELLIDVNSGLGDIARLLRRDTALASRIIRISNSAAFGLGGQVGSIEEAVSRVGFTEIYRLTGIASVAQLEEENLVYYGLKGVQVRDNALCTALAAEALATRMRRDPRTAYTSGLLRSTGKLVLNRIAARTPSAFTPFTSSGGTGLPSWELTSFGCNNAEVAETVLSAWRFPPAVILPVRYHLEDTPQSAEHTGTAALLRVAGGIADAAGYGLLGENNCWIVPPAVLHQAGLSPPLVKEAAEEAMNAFEAIKGSI